MPTALIIPDLSVVAPEYGRPGTSVITPDPLWAWGGTGRQTACLAPVFTLMSTFDSSRAASGSRASPLLHLHRRDVSWVRRPKGKPRSVSASLIRLSPGCNAEAAGDIGAAAPSTSQGKNSTLSCQKQWFFFSVWENESHSWLLLSYLVSPQVEKVFKLCHEVKVQTFT